MPYDLKIEVYRSDKITLDQVRKRAPDYMLISPGPKDPAHAGISVSLIKSFYKMMPILGVCLGMQCMNEAFGGRTDRSPCPMHGKTSQVQHNGSGIFRGVPSPFRAARYHSLMTTLRSKELVATAYSRENVIMGLSHSAFPLHGVQFHPESFLTDFGARLVENFLILGPLRKAIHNGSG